MDSEGIKEYNDGKRLIIFNLCNLNHKNQARFLQMYNNAVKEGISGVKFVKTWNHYAQDISEHVFWYVKGKKFIERGK